MFFLQYYIVTSSMAFSTSTHMFVIFWFYCILLLLFASQWLYKYYCAILRISIVDFTHYNRFTHRVVARIDVPLNKFWWQLTQLPRHASYLLRSAQQMMMCVIVADVNSDTVLDFEFDLIRSVGVHSFVNFIERWITKSIHFLLIVNDGTAQSFTLRG